MNCIDFVSGFYTALAFSCGIFFLTSRKRRAPFREAFGWMTMYGAVENLFFYIIRNSGWGDEVTRELVCVCADMTSMPLMGLVSMTIVDQDMVTRPFKERWKRIAIIEIPLVVCMGICALTQYEWRMPMVVVVLFSNIIGVIGYSTYNLVRYEKRLPDDIKGRRASIKWMWYLVALMVLLGIMYVAVGNYITDVTYYIALCACTFIAAYFINKQSPIDTRQMLEAAITQEDAADDNSTEPESHSLTRKDMEVKVKHYMAEHPKFGDRLAERAVQKLTVRDMFLCIMIIEGKRVGEIAETLAISATSVEVARYRLRSKLNLNKGENLAKALKASLE